MNATYGLYTILTDASVSQGQLLVPSLKVP